MPSKGPSSTSPTTPRVTAGDRIGEWILDAPIGGGAFGTVWRAKHHVWADQLVAVKLPHDPAYVRALRREGVWARKLDHPNIVRPLGFDPFAERPYLVMEYVPGVDLRRLLADKGPMPPESAVAVLLPILSALGYAHDHGFVHRDIKPENILIHERAFEEETGLATEGVVKVTDFGLGAADNAIANAKGAVGQQSIVFSTDLSGEKGAAVAGTLDYMAPEQRNGSDPVDGRADLYACGVLLFEMLTGERPAGTDVPSDVKAGLPKAFDDLFRRSYARLEKRFVTADEFANALKSAASGRVAASEEPVTARTTVNVNGGACPSCGGGVAGDDQFCMHCGTQLVGSVRRCGKCGAFPAPDDNFCMFCGHNLRPPERMRRGTDLRV